MRVQVKFLTWTFIGFFTFLIHQTHSEEILDPCDLSNNEGSMVMYCQCDLSPATEVQCYVNNDLPQKSDSRPEWLALSTLTETIYLEFVMRTRFMKQFPPPILFQKLTKLKVFYVKTSGIDIIPSYAFQNSSSITEVNLKDNMIRELEPYAFANMVNVKEINLDSNKILTIERNIFVNLPNLLQLCLGANSIEIIHDQALKHLKRLEELELQKNNLTYLTPEVFMGLGSLKRLDLMKNTIQFLGNNVFGEMPNLEDLDLTENNIISVSPTAFHGLTKLGRLNLRFNKIVEFQPGTFAQLSNIYHLDVRNNELETFSKDLISDMYKTLLNGSLQLMMNDNRFKCDCRILWMQRLWNETKSQMVQYYLNLTMCDIPHKYSLDETDLNVIHKGGSPSFENVTLISGPIEATTISATGSSLRVTAFTGEGLRCGEDPRKGHRHRTGQRRIKEKTDFKAQAQNEEKELMIEVIPGRISDAPEPGNDNPGPLGSAPPSSSSNVNSSLFVLGLSTFFVFINRFLH